MLVANIRSIYLRLQVLLVVAVLALVAGESAFAQDSGPAGQAAEAVDSEASGQETGASESSGQDASATSDTNTDNLPPIEIGRNRLHHRAVPVEPPNQLIALFPLVLIPTFLVPVSILLHVASLTKLHRTRSRGMETSGGTALASS